MRIRHVPSRGGVGGGRVTCVLSNHRCRRIQALSDGLDILMGYSMDVTPMNKQSMSSFLLPLILLLSQFSSFHHRELVPLHNRPAAAAEGADASLGAAAPFCVHNVKLSVQVFVRRVGTFYQVDFDLSLEEIYEMACRCVMMLG